MGYVITLKDRAEVEGVKEITGLVDDEPLVSPEMVDLLKWMADYYMVSLGDLFRTALPAGIGRDLKPLTRKWVELTDEGLALDLNSLRGKEQRRLIEFLREKKGQFLSALEDAGLSPSAVKALVEKGLATVRDEVTLRSPQHGVSNEKGKIPTLTAAQKTVVDRLTASIKNGGFVPFLLHGVTGSGKTEVYLRATAAALEQGKDVVVLVPEISLTPQFVARFAGRFGNEVAVLHSGLSDGERYDEWRRLRSGAARIAIGARSAVFAPVRNPGLIIVDEEHDSSYKQEEGVHYHARDVAVVRAKLCGATILLGSATPSIESYHNTERGKYTLLTLPERIDHRPMPEVRVVEMGRQAEGRRLKAEETVLVAPEVQAAVDDHLARGQQVLLFLNRRGFNTFLFCNDCGESARCPNCSISLTFYKRSHLLRCHYCEHSAAPHDLCPQCGSHNLRLIGHGTERLEDEVEARWPEVSIARMDRDTTSRKGAHHRIIAGMESGEHRILIGTQMVAKGHDLPGVTLVGILFPEGTLNLPDFRSAERTFQMITQVAGRAGRGETPGEVLVQAFNPEHYAVRHALQHDYPGFYAEELIFRKELGYPPFSRLVLLMFRGVKEEAVAEAAGSVAEIMKKALKGCGEVLGPVPSPLTRVRGKYRWQVILKGKEGTAFRRQVQAGIVRYEQSGRKHGVELLVDVDPQSLM